VALTRTGLKVWELATLPPPRRDDAPGRGAEARDRAAARMVLKQGGIVHVLAEGSNLDVNNPDALPQGGSFRVTARGTLGGKPITDAALGTGRFFDLKRSRLNDPAIVGLRAGGHLRRPTASNT